MRCGEAAKWSVLIGPTIPGHGEDFAGALLVARSLLSQAIPFLVAAGETPVLPDSMRGSRRHEYHPPAAIAAREVFCLRVAGQTLWGWQRRDAEGGIRASSEHLFPDYVACLCDAQRRS
jgi:hypothetical protein